MIRRARFGHHDENGRRGNPHLYPEPARDPILRGSHLHAVSPHPTPSHHAQWSMDGHRRLTFSALWGRKRGGRSNFGVGPLGLSSTNFMQFFFVNLCATGFPDLEGTLRKYLIRDPSYLTGIAQNFGRCLILESKVHP